MSAGGSLLGVSVLEIRTDQTGLDAGLASAKAKTGATTKEMQASMNLAGRATADAAVKLQGYQLAVQAAHNRVSGLSRAIQSGHGDQQKLNDALQVAQGRLGIAQSRLESYTAKTTAAGREMRSLSASTGVSSRAFSDLTSHMGPTGRVLDDLTTRSRLYRQHGVDYLAAGMLGLEGAIVGLSVRAALRFEELGKTVAQQTGLSGESLDHLMGVIRTVGRDSPYTMAQIADAAVILRQEFHATDAQIGQWSNDMVAFANAAGQDVRPQMQQLSRIMTDFRMPMSDVVTLTDKLVAVAQATQQPIGGMTNALDKFGPKLQALGFDLNDSVKLLGLFQASGLKADQMGRGLASALTLASKGISNNNKVLADGPEKLKRYAGAVETAQLRVDTLSAKLASGKGNQKLLNEQMTIAEGKLSAAKDKYSALNAALETAKKAHGDIASTVHAEMAQIEGAHSKQDALNIAIADFGKNLGPSMARALYGNQAALEKVDKALGKTGATQRLFGVDQASIAGKTQEAKNNFQDLEITIGTKLVPALSTLLGWVRTGVHDIDNFVKHNQKLVEVLGAVAGGVSAITLLSRHSPLGNILGRLIQTDASGVGGSTRRGIAGVLSGGGSSAMFGVRGPVGAGGLTNPVAVVLLEGGQAGLGSRAAPGTTRGVSGGGVTGTVAGGAVTAEEEAAAAESRTLSSTMMGGLALAGKVFLPIAALGAALAAASAKGGVLDRLAAGVSGATMGIVPASTVRSGLGTVTGMTTSGLRGGVGSAALTGAAIGSVVPVIGTLAGAGIGAIGSELGLWGKQASAGEQAANKFGGQLKKVGDLSKLSADQIAKLDQQAGRLAGRGDITKSQRDSLNKLTRQLDPVVIKNMLGQIANVQFPSEPQFIQQLNKSFKSLSGTGRKQGADAMIALSASLEQQGRLPKGATDKLIHDIEQKYPALKSFIVATGHGSMQDLATEFQSQKVISSVQDQVALIQKDWGLLPGLAKTNGSNVYANWKAAIDAVKEKMQTGSAASREAATVEYHKLLAMQDSVTATMVSHWANQLDSMKGKGAGDFSSMASAGIAALTAIGLTTNQALKALGLTPLQFSATQITGAVAGSVNGVIGSIPFFRAGGGVVQLGSPGEAGRDSIALNFGGVPIMAAPGEKLAVINRHQAPDFDRRFADYGGLEGYFAKNKKPNYMASGGIVPGYAAGGISFSGPVSTFGPPGEPAGGTAGGHSSSEPGLSLRIPGTTWSDAQNRALMGHVFRTTIAGHTANLLDFDLGPADWTGKNIDVTGAGVAALGIPYGSFPTGAVGTVQEIIGGVATAVGAGMSAGATSITAPKINGPSGPLTNILQSVSDKVAAGANAYLASHMPAANVGVAGGGLGVSGPSGLGSFDGLQVADWIIPILNWARGHGWGGHITSGYRPGGSSEHAGIQYPGGAVDVGWNTSIAEGTALEDVIARYPGHPNLLWGGTYISGYTDPRGITAPGGHDYGHFSGTGHARGGLVSLASQGMLTSAPTGGSGLGGKAPKGTGKDPSKLKKKRVTDRPMAWRHNPPPGSWQHHPFSGGAPITGPAGGPPKPGAGGAAGMLGADGPLPFSIGDLDPINSALSWIFSLDGGDPTGIQAGPAGDAVRLQALISQGSNLWQSALYPSPNFSDANNPSAFVISTDAAGNPVAPYVSTNINQVASELAQVIGWEGQILADMQGALKLTQALQPAVQRAIARRTVEAKKIVARMKANFQKIKALQAKIKALQAKKPPHPNAKTAAQKAANAAFETGRKTQIAGWNKQITTLKAENFQLGGATDGSVGAGMEIGAINEELGTPGTNALGEIGVATGASQGASGGLYGLQDALGGWAGNLNTPLGSSTGIGSVSLQRQTDQLSLAALLPGASSALATQLASATTSTSGASSSTSADQSALLALLKQQLQTSGEELAVSQAQYNVLANFPPFGGSFADGGVIPGPLGAARTVIAHGGEVVSKAGGSQPPQVHVNFSAETGWLKKFVQVEVRHETRQIARSPALGLPSRGGGQLLGAR